MERYKVRYSVFLILLLLLMPFSFAVSYSVVVTPIYNDIMVNESASYEVSISNFQTTPGEFQVYSVDPSWNVKTEPLDLRVSGTSQKTFMLYLRPLTTAEYGLQGITVNFKDLATGTVIKKPIVLSLQNHGGTKSRDYVPTVSLDVLMPYELDPRTAVPLRLQLKNRNPLNITGLTIKVSSPHFDAEEITNLGPLSEKTRDITGLTLHPLTAPGEADVIIQLIYAENVIGQVTKNYKIKEYTQIKQDVKERSFFFKNTKDVVITNNGNVKNTAVVSVPTSLIKSLFVSATLPYQTIVKDGERVLLWNIPLSSDESATFTYTENYRILILLVLLALAGGISYFILRSPVVSIKEAVAIAHPEGISDIKVRIFIKNRSSRIIQGIRVTDKVPSLAEVVKSDSMGTIAPTKVAVSEKQGTLLRWDLEVLEPYEERVITYKIKSKLKIIGRMKLPNAKIHYVHNSKERVVYSNNIELIEKFQDQ